MRYGVCILPDARWAEAGQRWQLVEAWGFHHAWTYDHLTWRNLRDGPWFGALPTLTAAAMVTSRIRLGTLVATPNFRHPVTLAKEVMTLDDLSGGRFTLGLGAGTDGHDAQALGGAAWSAQERGARFREFVGQLDTLLRTPAVDLQGEYYSAVEARSVPGCLQRPRVPFLVSALGPQAMRLAATVADGWVTVDGYGDPGALLQRFGAACAEAGRDPAAVDRVALLGFSERPLRSVQAFQDCAGRLADLGFTDMVVHWPRTEEPFTADVRVLERIAADVLA